MYFERSQHNITAFDFSTFTLQLEVSFSHYPNSGCKHDWGFSDKTHSFSTLCSHCFQNIPSSHNTNKQTNVLIQETISALVRPKAWPLAARTTAPKYQKVSVTNQDRGQCHPEKKKLKLIHKTDCGSNRPRTGVSQQTDDLHRLNRGPYRGETAQRGNRDERKRDTIKEE